MTELDFDFEIAVARYRQSLFEELLSDRADVKLDISGCDSRKVESAVLVGHGIEGAFANRYQRFGDAFPCSCVNDSAAQYYGVLRVLPRV